jgi:drug/metabolite transporter (DMT)-like permease
VVWLTAWAVSFIAARLALESPTSEAWRRMGAAILAAPLAGMALLSILRSARQLDELEQRIQLEALAIAFVLGVLLLMTLGLMELAITLSRNDWSYRHVCAMLPLFYLIGLAISRRRYT